VNLINNLRGGRAKDLSASPVEGISKIPGHTSKMSSLDQNEEDISYKLLSSERSGFGV
jgi:hypothetical protein